MTYNLFGGMLNPTLLLLLLLTPCSLIMANWRIPLQCHLESGTGSSFMISRHFYWQIHSQINS